MRRHVPIVCGLIATLTTLGASAPARAKKRARFPETHLEVTVGQLADGDARSGATKLSKAFQVIRLQCSADDCSIETLTLNDCVDGFFYPKMERVSVSEGTLAVEFTPHAVQAQFTLPGTEHQMEFDYYREKGDRFIARLNAFAGGSKKILPGGKRGPVVGYAAIPEHQTIRMDCPAGGLVTLPDEASRKAGRFSMPNGWDPTAAPAPEEKP